MKKNLLKFLMLTMVVGLALTIAAPVMAGNSGDLKSTDATGSVVNDNVFYMNKFDVYIQGANFAAGNYWVKVTTPGGDILGKSLTASLVVGSDGKFVGPGGKDYVQLWDIVYRTSESYAKKGYDDTTNPGGEYKVWVSLTSDFQQKKTDNFKVSGPSAPVPELPSVLLFGIGLLGVAGIIAKKKLTKATVSK
jgi:hypothetical protein